jgi:TnpA family transposase
MSTIESRFSGRKAQLTGDPSEEDLARDWTLSAEDKAEVLKCRGDENRRRFAIQLCHLKARGRFLSHYSQVSAKIANHLGRQLSLAPSLFVEPPRRSATETEHEGRIRRHLGFERFDAGVQQRLERLLAVESGRSISARVLLERAESVLYGWKVVLPARSTLERIVASVDSQAHEEIFERVAGQLTPGMRQELDELVLVPEGQHRSPLSWLKDYPPEPTSKSIKAYIERYRYVESISDIATALDELSPTLVRHLAQLAKQYDARDLKRLSSDAKRHTIVAAFVVETRKTLLDHLVAMNDKFMTGMERRARNSFERRHKLARDDARQGLDTVLRAMEILMDPARKPAEAREELYQEIDEGHLRQALQRCHAFQHQERRGYLEDLWHRYSHLKRHLPAFLSLPFRAEPGSEPLLGAMDLAQRLNVGEIKELPSDAPDFFIRAKWRKELVKSNGKLDRRIWETGLAFAIREALRAGDLYLPASRHHVSFSNLIYDDTRWTQEREQAYLDLGVTQNAAEALGGLRREYEGMATALQEGLPDNPFVSIEEGKLKLKRQDALEVPQRLRNCKRAIEAHLPRIRIEQLLFEVDSWCHFTKQLRPLGGYQPRSKNSYTALLAALVAHGTNLGIATMGESAEGLSVDMLLHASRWFLREETLKAANSAIVEYHHQQPMTAVWGDGTTTASDGQRFGIEASSLLASFYPRYFGYYDRAISVYTHVSDQYSVIASQAISCSPREAIYVLDGLLENDSVVRPREHFTDTHGYTEQLFGLCYLLGFSFMPRIKDLKSQRVYRLDRSASYGSLDQVFKRTVNLSLVQEQWDQLVRVAASLQNRTAPAHVVLRRLSSSSPSDRLAKALTALGQAVKTVFILRYLNEPKLRQRIQLQLNRTESRHQLAKRLFFANQGSFRTGDYEEIMNKVSALSLLSNAVLVWNTAQMEKIIDSLRQGGQTVEPEDLARVSPLANAHVIPNGTYHFPKSEGGGDYASNTLQ